METGSYTEKALAFRRQCIARMLDPANLEGLSSTATYGMLKAVDELFPGLEDAQAQRQDTYRLDALLIADGFAPVRRDVLAGGHTEYLLTGGRGSTKSSFVSLMLVELLLQTPDCHLLVVRQVAATLRDSVYAQMCWAIEAAGLKDAFSYKSSVPEIERKGTGQKIYFRGADDPMKMKSIKPKKGAIGALWFEELDQFTGEAAVRSIEQSALRGTRAVIFKTFNPPRYAGHWANRYAAQGREDQLRHHSTYRSALVPPEWLGPTFLERAAALEQADPEAYAHEYGGEANLAGGPVFQNIVQRPVTDEEIAGFDRFFCGVDWGYYPDPWVFNRVAWQPHSRRLIVFCEAHELRRGNSETAAIVKAISLPGETIVCDSAEPKSIDDYRATGLKAQGAKKGPGSIQYSLKWLLGLREIVIDPGRCPATLAELAACAWESDREGNATGGLAKTPDHHLDAIRYATERIWGRREREKL